MASRFSNSPPTKGRLRAPERILIFGPQGAGKTETLAQVPGVAFIDLHGSTSNVDVSRVCDPWSVGDTRPPQTYEELCELIDELPNNPHYKGLPFLVLDGADDIDKLVQRSAAMDHGKMSLEDIQWKAGYATVIQKWIELLSKLATLQAKMGCGIGLTANDQTFSVPNPDGPEFLAYMPAVFRKVSEKNCYDAAKEISRWCYSVWYLTIQDSVRRGGYVQTEQGAVQIDNNKILKEAFGKASSSGSRECYTRYHGWCQYTKNRIGLPSVMRASSPASMWAIYQHRLNQFHTVDPKVLQSIIDESYAAAVKAGAKFDDARFKAARDAAGQDPEALRKVITGIEATFSR
mgnify:CR=1 FL=1